MSFFDDIFNLAFRSGVPYDPQINQFKIGPAEAARMDFQRQQEQEMNQWINQPIKGFDNE
jgi:hypothetical protein